jgi:hypothetical protein
VIRSLEEHLDLDKKMILETIEELKKIWINPIVNLVI